MYLYYKNFWTSIYGRLIEGGRLMEGRLIEVRLYIRYLSWMDLNMLN